MSKRIKESAVMIFSVLCFLLLLGAFCLLSAFFISETKSQPNNGLSIGVASG